MAYDDDFLISVLKEVDYVPTIAERKILLELADVSNIDVPVSKICEKAEVSRNVYYAAMKKEGFQKIRKALVDRMLIALTPDIKMAAIRFATQNAKNHNDRKMLLEMAGEYKSNQSITVKSGIDIENLTEEEINKRIKEISKKGEG